MDYKVVFTRRSEYDLTAILEYLTVELDSAPAAGRFSRRLDRVLKNLSSMPEMYDTLDQNPSLRKVPIGKYLMIFRLDPSSETVQILRFFHGTQDYEAIL